MSSTPVAETFTIGYSPQTFPAGTGQVASVTLTTTGAAAGNTTPVVTVLAPGQTSVTVNLVPDTYQYSLQALDGSNNDLGVALTGSFTVVASGGGTNPGQVTLQIPSSVTVSP